MVYADMVGYSRLIGLDDQGTLNRLRAVRREMIDPAIEEHGGRIVQTGGDSLLIVFDSIDGAVRCAVQVQQQVPIHDGDQPPDRAIRFRIGINIGDAIADGTDLHGDAVNIAARLQAECPPGGICVSRSVRDHVHGRLGLEFEKLGLLNLKNIARPVEAFVLQNPDANDTPSCAPRASTWQVPALPSGWPSLAVLAFTNMSGDPEQEYFSDGIADDIITELSRGRSLFVMSRNSTFTYKNRPVDVKQVAHDLGVRYVVEGSVRRMADRIRISCQLTDALTGGHIWAERFDGDKAGIFELQDRVIERVVSAIEPSLQRVEALRASSKPTGSLDAYDCYLRALLHFHGRTRESLGEAVKYLSRALEFDSSYAIVKGFLSYLFVIRNAFGWGEPSESERAERLAREAISANPYDPVTVRWVGHPLVYFAGDFELAELVVRRALQVSPHAAQLARTAGLVLMMCDKPLEALDHCERAIRLSPLDPEMPTMQMEYGMALVLAGRDDEGLVPLNRAVTEMPALAPAYRFLIVALWRLNRMDLMRKAASKLLTVDPKYRISTHIRPFKSRTFLDHYVKALRAAGLPD